MKPALSSLRQNVLLRKILGVILIIVGLIALITPLTPGSWLAFIGFELLGWRLTLVDKISHKIKRTVTRRKQ